MSEDFDIRTSRTDGDNEFERALRPLALAYMLMLCVLSVSLILPLLTAFWWGKLVAFFGATFDTVSIPDSISVIGEYGITTKTAKLKLQISNIPKR